MKYQAGGLKKGDYISYQGEIWQVTKTDFNFQGRGMAVVRFKIKSLISGKNIEVAMKSVDPVESADVANIEMQFLYIDGSSLHFMDEKTYQQITVPVSVVGDVASYLQPGAKYFVIMHGEDALNIRPPASVKLKVIESEEAIKGDTVSGAKKQATLETGVKVMVPLFIKVGDTIAVNPETGEYVERVKS